MGVYTYVIPLERHRDLRRLGLGGEVQAHGLHEGDLVVQGHGLGAGVGVHVGAPVRRAADAAHVLAGVDGVEGGGLHLRAERLELGEGDVARAALGALSLIHISEPTRPY